MVSNFIWFFLTVFLFTSLISYTIHSGTIFEETDVSYTSIKNGIGDLAIRTFYIYALYHTSGQLTLMW